MQSLTRSIALLWLFSGLAAVTAGESPPDIMAADLKALDHISRQGVEIVSGMVETFLHRSAPTQAETACMLSSVENVTHVLYKASADVASSLGALLGSDGTIAEAAAAAADLLLLVPQLEASLDTFVDLLGGFMGPCLGGSAAQALQRAGGHLGNLTYVAGHLQANGADIVREMASAYEAFGAGKLAHFGRSIGRACRKVLLSKASAPSLPEGAPSLPQLVNMSAGILQGFFGRGAELDILSDGAPEKPHAAGIMEFRTSSVEADVEGAPWAAGTVAVRIDLHKCVKNNLESFQSAVLQALFYFARQDLASESDPAEALPALLTSAMAEGPALLGKCGISEEQQEMLASALEALDSLRVELKLPRLAAHPGPHGALEQLQRAADDWKALDWFALGRDLGRMMLQLLVQVFPEKYSVDDAGALGARLADLSAACSQAILVGRPLLLAAAVPTLVALAALRGMRRRTEHSGAEPRGAQGDLESTLQAAVE